MSWDTGADAWSGEDQTTGGGDWASGGPTAAVEEYADQEQSAPVDLSGRQYGVVKVKTNPYLCLYPQSQSAHPLAALE